MNELKLRKEVVRQLTQQTFHDEFECADSIIKSIRDYDNQEERFLKRALSIVLKEPERISSSASTRQGFVTAVNMMERELKREFSNT